MQLVKKKTSPLQILLQPEEFLRYITLSEDVGYKKLKYNENLTGGKRASFHRFQGTDSFSPTFELSEMERVSLSLKSSIVSNVIAHS